MIVGSGLAPLAVRLILISAATAIAVAVWMMPDGSDLPVPAGGISRPGTTGNAENTRPAGTIHSQIDQHPLFYPTREPWKRAESTPLQQPSPVDLARTYTLVGIVVSGSVRSALLRPTNGGQAVSVTEGQLLDGWVLRSVGADGLHFGQNDTDSVLTFVTPQSGRKSGLAAR